MIFFKNTTTNHVVVFGRKTFESIKKPLKNRINVILTKNPNYKVEGCFVFNNIEDIIKKFKNENEIFICGGVEIYNYFFEKKLIKKIYLTKVDYNGIADRFLDLKYLNKWNYKKIKNIYKNNKNEYNAEIFIGNNFN